MIGIYKITSPSNNVYIGQSVDIEKRFLKYKKLNCKEQIRLYRSLLKYGYENHKIEIIEECNIELLNERERYYQDLYNAIGKKGLNCRLTASNDRSGKLSKETKDKISKNASRHFLGKKHSDDSKLKISNSLKGKQSRLGAVLSEETKDKIRNKHLGKKHSKETILKMSKSQRKRDFTYLKEQNKKLVIDLNSGIFYNSVKEAAISLDINIGTLGMYLSGKRENKTSLIYA